MASKKPTPSSEADLEIPTPTVLDPETHSEFLALYNESTKTMRFIKNHQWKTVGATLFLYLGLVLIASQVHVDKSLKQSFMWVTIILCCGVILTLVIYQFWMQNELRKIAAIEQYMSSGFGLIRGLKPSKEGNIHRYVLLSFMFALVILGAIVVSMSLTRIH